MNEGDQDLIQWHPAFRGAVKTELEAEEGLHYLEEHALTKKELKVDLIVLDQKNHSIGNAIGHLFRQYNILEYKSPTDYFSLDDYYKVMAYAYLYKSTADRVDGIPIEGITVSLVCDSYPRKMLQHIRDTWDCSIKLYQPGIYYIDDRIPLQLIITAQLETKEHKWLKSLTNHITVEELGFALADYSIDLKNENKDVIIDTIVKANEMQLKIIKEENQMSKELLKLMEPEINQIKEAYAEEYAEKLKQQQQQQQKQFIVQMAKQGIDVMKIVDITGMSEGEVKEILDPS